LLKSSGPYHAEVLRSREVNVKGVDLGRSFPRQGKKCINDEAWSFVGKKKGNKAMDLAGMDRKTRGNCPEFTLVIAASKRIG